MGGPSAAGAATMALVLLLSLHTAQVSARTPAWSQADFSRHLQGLASTTCPAGSTPIRRGTVLTPPQGAVTWQDLRNLGWDLPATRPTKAGYATSGLFNSSSFASIMCNGWKEVTGDRRGCTNTENGAFGAAHIRYNCTTGQIWVLAYAFNGVTFSTSTDNMWVRTCAAGDACDNGGGGGPGDKSKFIKYGATASPAANTCGVPGGVCSTECDGNECPWCCNSMWGVMDGASWVGYLGAADFRLPAGTTVTSDRIVIHWNSGGSTVSTAGDAPPLHLCFNCSAETSSPPPPGPEDSCIPGGLTVTSNGTSSYCVGSSSQVVFDFAVTNDAPTVPVNYTITPTPATLTCTGTTRTGGYVVTCSGSNLPAEITVILGATQFVPPSCDRTPESTSTATGTQPPTVSVAAAATSSPQCASSGQFALAVTPTATSNAAPVSVSLAATPEYCSVVPPTTDVLSGTSKTVTCNKPDPAGWPATFNVNVTATATNAGCPASASGASAVTVYTRPVVNVTGDSTAQLCDNATQLVLTYGVSSGESGAPLTINVTAPGVDCSSPATVTPPANTVQVTCTKQTGASWPEGGFTVSVKAQAAAGTAAGLTGCDSESTLDTVVTVNKLPEVSVESPPAWATVTGSGTSAPTVCSSDNQLNFNYTVTTGTSGLPYTLLTDRNYCTVTPSTSQASGQSVAVSCTKAEEQFWPASLTVTATSGAAADCSASDTDTVAITVLPKPDVSVTGPETEDVCSNATEVSFAYTVSSGQGSTTPLDLTVESTDATVTCTASSATQVTPGSVTITCEKTGTSWPEGGFNVTVTASAAVGTAAGLTGCSDSESATTHVTVNKLPEVSVESPPAWATVTGSGTSAPTVCSSDNQLNLNYTVTTGTSGLPYALQTDSNYCTVTPSTNQASGQSVAVSCTKADAETWPESLTVTATSGAAADCAASDTDTVTITVLPKPDVSVTGPETEAICNSVATEVSFAYTVSSGQGSTTPLDLTVESTDATVTCTASSANPVSPGSVTITCEKTGTTWPEGGFNVTVTASAAVGTDAGLTGCSDSESATTQVTVNKLPSLSVGNPLWATLAASGAAAPQICSSDTVFSLNYTVGTGDSGLPFNVATTTADCAVTPAGQTTNVASGSTVTLTCSKTGGWSSGFNVSLQATSGVTGCGDSKELSVPVTVNMVPTVNLTGPASVAGCSSGSSVTLEFQTTARVGAAGVPWTVSAVSDVAGVTCTTATGTGSATTRITCSTAEGATLPASFTAMATLQAGASGCAATAIGTTTVNSMCCASGSSYARGAIQGSTLSSATCFTSNPNCGANNWGWTNKLSGPITTPTAYPIIVGAGRCQGGQQVGTVSITCASSGGVSMVTLGSFNQRIVGSGIVNHVYIGCEPNNACTPPDFWTATRSAPKPPACTGSLSNARRCGGTAPVSMFTNEQPLQARLQCDCSSVHWVLHQSYNRFTVERNAAGNCPAV